MAAMLKPSAEYNRRTMIIEGLRARHSATEIIRFFGYHQPFMTLWQNIRTVQRRFQYARKSHSKERTARTLAVVKRAQLLISDDPEQSKISIDCWCKRANNASNCRGEPSIQIVHIKDTTDALWGCQDKPSCSPRLPILPFQQPRFKSLGLLRMEHSWKSHRQVSYPNVTSLRTAKVIFVDMDSYITACEPSDREQRSSFELMGDILNNCALQGSSPKCHVKGFFVIFNFSV